MGRKGQDLSCWPGKGGPGTGLGDAVESCVFTAQQCPGWGCLRKVGLEDDSRGPGRVLALGTGGTALPTHLGRGPGFVLTQTGTEKKAKAMAALALLFPKRKCSDFECCHWLARKQKATNQTPAQRTGGARREESWTRVLGQGQGLLGMGLGVL